MPGATPMYAPLELEYTAMDGGRLDLSWVNTIYNGVIAGSRFQKLTWVWTPSASSYATQPNQALGW